MPADAPRCCAPLPGSLSLSLNPLYPAPSTRVSALFEASDLFAHPDLSLTAATRHPALLKRNGAFAFARGCLALACWCRSRTHP